MRSAINSAEAVQASAAALSQQPFMELLRIALLACAAAALRAAHTAQEWRRRANGRRCLAAMGERELRDLGLSRSDAHVECGKPFWRA